jgi:hypothetical protein
MYYLFKAFLDLLEMPWTHSFYNKNGNHILKFLQVNKTKN